MLGNHPIVPKNSDGVARIISIGRLSQPKETEAATKLSLDAIRRENERLLKTIYEGRSIVHYLGEQIGGLIPKRVTMDALWELVASGEWDLIIAEDLSRIFRNPRFQLAFLQDSVDAGIRVICFADQIDTADESWETATLIALVRHGLPIPDTRRRIRRTATESFARGGMVMKVKAFYAKVSRDNAAAGTYGPKGLRIRKLDELAWAVDGIRRRLHAGESPRFIVAWLNTANVPCGPYVESGKWSKTVLRDLLQDPILHGTRTFRDVVHKQIHGSGKYRREKSATPDQEYVAELAFMTRDEQEAMLETVGWSIDWGGAKQSPRPHPRKGISRYESYWPAQSATCNVCGDTMYACGQYLRCCNGFGHLGGTCWNHCQVPISLLRTATVRWLVARCDESADFRDVLLEAAKRELQQVQSRSGLQRDSLEAQVKELESHESNLRRSIRVGADVAEEDLAALVTDLAAVTQQLRNLRRQAACAAEQVKSPSEYSEDEVLPHLREVLEYLLAHSFEMAEVVRGFIPRCVIVPVQSLDTSQVYPRAKLLVRGNMQEYDDVQELVINLFEPALHVRIMPEAVRQRRQVPRPTYKQIGAELGTSYMTVKRALAYARRMDELGASDPYHELSTKPENAARWRDAS